VTFTSLQPCSRSWCPPGPSRLRYKAPWRGRAGTRATPPGQQVLLDQHFGARGPGQIAELIVGTLGEQQMTSRSAFSSGKASPPPVCRRRRGRTRSRDRAVVECGEELRAAVGRLELGNRFSEEGQTVMVVVLVDAARQREAAVLVLNVSPQQVVSGRSGSSARLDSGSRSPAAVRRFWKRSVMA